MTCALRLTTDTIQAIDDKIKEFDEIRADVIARLEELSGTVTSASERLDQDLEFVAAFLMAWTPLPTASTKPFRTESKRKTR